MTVPRCIPVTLFITKHLLGFEHLREKKGEYFEFMFNILIPLNWVSYDFLRLIKYPAGELELWLSLGQGSSMKCKVRKTIAIALELRFSLQLQGQVEPFFQSLNATQRGNSTAPLH
jgi:hypothetical protein